MNKRSVFILRTLNRDLFVWGLLIACTLFSWWLGGGSEWFDRSSITTVVIVVSMIKARLVIRYFMEVKTAPLVLRLVMDLWCGAVGGVLVYLLR